MSFAVGVLEIGYGVILCFSTAALPATARGLSWISTLLLLGGVCMLLLLRYRLQRWQRNLMVLISASPLLLMAHFHNSADGRLSRLVYGILAASVLLLGMHRDESESATKRIDILRAVYGILGSLVGTVMLVMPQYLPAETFTPAGPLVRPLALVVLFGSVGTLLGDRLSRLHPWLPALAKGAAVAFTVAMGVIDLWSGFYVGALFKLAFGAALVFQPSLIRRNQIRMSPGETDVAAEDATEAWNWLLAIGAGLMTLLQQNMDPRTLASLGYSVTALVVYNLVAFWLLPNLGGPDTRLLWHLHVFAIATAHLSQGDSAAAYAMVAFSLVPPILAARALGRRAGYSVLATNLGFFLLVAVERDFRWAEGFLDPARLVPQVLGVGLAGTMVIRNALEQRHMAQQLQGAREELQATNEELQAVNEELLAQNEELTEASEALVRLAERDPLTGLLNRRCFQEWLQAQLDAGSAGALLYMDLDHFKEINDNRGHAAGDHLLQRVAQVLTRESGEQAITARIGGDEFAILLPGAASTDATALAERILRQFTHLASGLAAESFPIQASIGITLYPEQANSVESLLIQADVAMYEVKRSGRNGVQVYEPRSGVSWELEVQRALAEGRFVLHFQPILDLRSRTVTRYEALLRMIGSDGKVVAPGVFLPHVESGLLMNQVDRWVIREAFLCLQGSWQSAGVTTLEVNLSGRAFDDPGLLKTIEGWLVELQVDPRRVIFEITETSAISDIQRARHFIQALRSHGCRFAIDDLGSGFASFSYLKHLPVDYIKIDGSLVKDLRQGRDQALVEGIVTIARGLGMQTIAEWVEDAETLELVCQCGVDYAQGYLIGYPAPMQQAACLVAKS
ncbi:MAG TPA: EAL domain-containing protein [Symbiobacteriaceae bacterium]|nr:EAL domain-containing protein [Symbiobacteriaceae bacterium]